MLLHNRFLKFCRMLHLYLGVFTAPALLFFAFTGFVQSFNWHEASHDGGSYKPPAWLAEMGQMHKKQTFVLPQRRSPVLSPQRVAGAVTPSAGPGRDAPVLAKPHTFPMKLFFAVVSVALFLSTLTGIYMSYRYTRRPRLVTAVWLAGIVLPVLLVLTE